MCPRRPGQEALTAKVTALRAGRPLPQLTEGAQSRPLTHPLPARRAGATVGDSSHLSLAPAATHPPLTLSPSCSAPARPPQRQRVAERPAPCACAQSLRAACLRLKWPSPKRGRCERGGKGSGGRISSCSRRALCLTFPHPSETELCGPLLLVKGGLFVFHF